jgi:hypothetical protein
MDCFVEPVIGPRFARTRWLAMTMLLIEFDHRDAGPAARLIPNWRESQTHTPISSRSDISTRSSTLASPRSAALRVVICPTADFPKSRQDPAAKIFRFIRIENQAYGRPVPLRQRDVSRSSRAWCGMRWTCWRRRTSGASADGEVVWSWSPDAGIKLVIYVTGDGGYQARHSGESTK